MKYTYKNKKKKCFQIHFHIKKSVYVYRLYKQQNLLKKLPVPISK